MRLQNLVLSILIIITSACETVVEVDIPREAPRLVVNAILEQDSVVRFQLSQSKSSLDSSPLQRISSAEAVLFKDGRQIAHFREEALGQYTADHQVEAGSEYSIRVSREGYEPVEAETFIRNPVNISSVRYDTLVTERSVYFREQDSMVINTSVNPSEIRLTINDPAGEKNYYEITVLEDATIFSRSYDDEGNPIIEDTVTYRFPAYLSSEDPVFGSSGEIFDDVSSVGGETLLFSDDIFDGREYTVNFNYEFPLSYSDENTNIYYVILRTLQREQYLYFRSVRLQSETEGNPFAEPVPVFNNIVGGYGIFTGFSRDQVIIELEE